MKMDVGNGIENASEVLARLGKSNVPSADTSSDGTADDETVGIFLELIDKYYFAILKRKMTDDEKKKIKEEIEEKLKKDSHQVTVAYYLLQLALQYFSQIEKEREEQKEFER